MVMEKEEHRGGGFKKPQQQRYTSSSLVTWRGWCDWFLDGKLDFSSNCFYPFFLSLCTCRAIWKGSTSVGA